jgi:DNA-binding PadR family transcriptional regulator
MNPSYLRMVVMQRLSEQPCSGYALVKHIAERTGWKPSFGSIYPLLERFQKTGLVTVSAQGRSKVYALTTKGRDSYRREHSTILQAHEGIIEQLKVLSTLGDTEAGVMANILEQHHRSGTPFHELPEITQLRAEIWRLMAEGKTQTHARQLVPVLKRTTLALKRF